MMHKHGGDVYTYGEVRDFSANINFRGMPEAVRKAALEAVERSVHYPDPECRTLRRALAERENRMYPGTGITPAQIICGNGAAEIMFALAAAYRPVCAWVAVPSFFEYEQAFTAFGCEIRRCYLRQNEDFRLGEDFLAKMRSVIAAEPREQEEGRRVLILGNPNNPTGRLIERGILSEILRLCRSHRILPVLDESFFDFLSAADRKQTFSGICGSAGQQDIFVIRSFTKIYALPGLRFGYGICRDESLLERMRYVLQPWNVSLPAQAAAEAAAPELAFAAETAARIAENRAGLQRALEADGYRIFPSNTNFLLLEGPEQLAEYCREQGFLIRNCSNFPGLETAGSGRAYFRVCVRGRQENEALRCVLAKAPDHMGGRKAPDCSRKTPGRMGDSDKGG